MKGVLKINACTQSVRKYGFSAVHFNTKPRLDIKIKPSLVSSNYFPLRLVLQYFSEFPFLIFLR